MYVYIQSEPGLLTVGHYAPDGKFHPDCDCSTKDEAGRRVAYLNGSNVTVDGGAVMVRVPAEVVAQAARASDFTKMPPHLRQALAWAVKRCAEWRGNLTGDAEAVSIFDGRMKLARRALALIRR